MNPTARNDEKSLKAAEVNVLMIVFLTMISLNSSQVTNSLTTKVDCLQFSHNGALLMASSSESKGIPYDLHFETVLTRKYIFRRCQNDRNCDK